MTRNTTAAGEQRAWRQSHPRSPRNGASTPKKKRASDWLQNKSTFIAAQASAIHQRLLDAMLLKTAYNLPAGFE